MADVERWLSYKGTCHVIFLAKLHDIYLYKTGNFFHISHYLKSISKVAVLHRFYCMYYKLRYIQDGSISLLSLSKIYSSVKAVLPPLSPWSEHLHQLSLPVDMQVNEICH